MNQDNLYRQDIHEAVAEYFRRHGVRRRSSKYIAAAILGVSVQGPGNDSGAQAEHIMQEQIRHTGTDSQNEVT